MTMTPTVTPRLRYDDRGGENVNVHVRGDWKERAL